MDVQGYIYLKKNPHVVFFYRWTGDSANIETIYVLQVKMRFMKNVQKY